ncbi:MAG: DUF4291 domain-containing protein [Sphingobacteriales bacterium]|jgi:hypothetical protein|nr:DUF4291 domain-containing protein [Sphingobacteriales bacterium]
MILKTIKYLDQSANIPKSGQVILGQQTDELIVLYQAYNKQIAEFATTHQKLGGSHFSYNRMSWIKPNFLWMMYRCGWAEKENQENVIAIWIKKSDFETILDNATYSSFKETVYQSIENWKDELLQKEVRLQWDPDHDPFGNKQERRAIQIGLKGKILKMFGEEMIQRIENITDFVKIQKQFVDKNEIENLLVPIEQIYRTTTQKLNEKLGIK